MIRYEFLTSYTEQRLMLHLIKYVTKYMFNSNEVSMPFEFTISLPYQKQRKFIFRRNAPTPKKNTKIRMIEVIHYALNWKEANKIDRFFVILYNFIWIKMINTHWFYFLFIYVFFSAWKRQRNDWTPRTAKNKPKLIEKS